jgi:hypothetical protein
MDKWLPRAESLAAAHGSARIPVPALWTSKIAQSYDPGKAILLELRKYVERKMDEGLAAAVDFGSKKGRPDYGSRCWVAVEALVELVGEIDRRTGQAGSPAQNDVSATQST